MVERGDPEAHRVEQLCFAGADGPPRVVGITGAPGAGKSTLTDRVVGHIRKEGTAVGVLAIDPSSPFSGGAILGDRVRMQGHALDESVFIRSMANRGHLGGLALAAPSAVRVLGAVGIPLVLIETVGVGQVEVEIAGEADTTVVVVNPGWGDAVQANKAGLLEIADVFVINKADRPGAAETRRDLGQMLDMNVSMGEWRPPIILTSASGGAIEVGRGREPVEGDGVDALWTAIEDHQAYLERSGVLRRRRRDRLVSELRQVLVRQLEVNVSELAGWDKITGDVVAGSLDPYTAADRLLGSLGT